MLGVRGYWCPGCKGISVQGTGLFMSGISVGEFSAYLLSMIIRRGKTGSGYNLIYDVINFSPSL